MLLDGLTVDDISGGGGGETTPPPKSKPYIGKRKREKEEEEKGEEDDEKEKTKDEKRVRRGSEGRERGRGAATWRMGRHIENVSVTITSLVYTTHSFLIFNADLEQTDHYSEQLL